MSKEQKSNIVLIGMPGVGKSTVGVILAKILGYEFIDTDIEIQRVEGKKLSQIIETEGSEGFVQIENRVNAQLQASGSVIATGGSVVYGVEAMTHLKEIGIVVYLKQNIWHLKRRLHNIKGRGVVLKPGQTLDDLFLERTKLYEQYADIVVDEHGLSVEETIQAVQEALSPYLKENN